MQRVGVKTHLKFIFIYVFVLVPNLGLAQYDSLTAKPLHVDIFDFFDMKKLAEFNRQSGDIVRVMEIDPEVKNYEFKFISSWKDKHSQTSYGEGAERQTEDFTQLDLNVTCDGEFKLDRSKSLRNSKGQYENRSALRGGPSGGVSLKVSSQVTSCHVVANDSYNEVSLKLVLENQQSNHSLIQKLRRKNNNCNDELQPTNIYEQIFLSNKVSNNTCASEVKIETVQNGVQGLKEKIKLLLGQDIPARLYETRSLTENGVDIPLDFSKAPKLKAVFISTLFFVDDFYGYLLGRILEFHAKRGTVVKIYSSENQSSYDSKSYANILKMRNPNINTATYDWRFKFSAKAGVGGILDGIHRVQHVKMFLTLGEEASSTQLYVGGRNYGNTYLEPVNPEKPDYVYFTDFEARIRDENFTHTMASRFLSLWEMDFKTKKVRSVNKTKSSQYETLDVSKNYIREFTSIPFLDGQQLENYFVDLFNVAKTSIKISTPYFSPTIKIMEALQKALARGVQVELLTNIDLNGDTAGSAITDINRININKFLGVKNFTVYHYVMPSTINHAKYIMIDDLLTLNGSINLNQRSFIHDIESLYLIYGKNYNLETLKVWNWFLSKSKKIEHKLPVQGSIQTFLLDSIFKDLD